MLVLRILRAAAVALTLCAAAAVALLVTLPAASAERTAALADLPGAVIGGSVLTEQGQPLAGVTVTLVALAGSQIATTTTDLAGGYLFTVTDAGDYFVAPSLPGRFFTPPDRPLAVPPGHPAADFVGAAAPATLSISGRTQTGAGAPIAGATIWAQAATGEVFTATAAPNGAFVVGNVITGVYVLTATSQTHYFATETGQLAVPPSQTDVRLIGEPYATIRGVVRDNSNAPLAAITVTAELTPARRLVAAVTDAQGAYTLTQLVAGRYRIAPAHANYRFTPAWRELATPPDAVADFVGEPHFVLHLPVVRRPPPDLTVRHIEVTQATQSDANSVPLVAGRPTLARIYALVRDETAANGLFLELTATRNGQLLGAVRQGPGTVWPNPVRDQYTTTFNVRLPAEWLTQEIELRARIDPDNAVAESDESNNGRTIGVAFQPMLPLQVKLVPINYTHLPTGVYLPGRWDAQELDFLKRVFPVSQVEVSVRAPLDFRGDLRSSEDWSALLSQLADIKMGDNAAPEQVYYGLIPVSPADGIAVAHGGLGFVGYRAAIGLVSQPEITAHEIGHNLGLLHAPCGDPAFVDPDYPYAGAQIGEYGVDVLGNRLLAATAYRDLMSYCGPRWISDYHYRKVFREQQVNGRSQPRQSGAGLWIRVRFDARGAGRLLPTYSLDAPLTAPVADSPYTVELLDAQGAVIAAHPLALLAADEEGLSLRMLSVIVPRPVQPVASLRVTANGAPLAIRTLDAAVAEEAAPVVAQRITRPSSSATLTWQHADRPALVRYSADGGQTWTTLGVDLSGGALDLPAHLRDAATLWEAMAGR